MGEVAKLSSGRTRSDALRGDTSANLDANAPKAKRGRQARLVTSQAPRVSPDEIAEVAMNVVLPTGVTDVIMTSRHTPGERLPTGDFSGFGGKTVFGPAWVLEGRLQSEPVHLYENVKDGLALYALLAGEEGELWDRKRRRREAIAAAEAAEEAAAAETKKSGRGGGSSRPKPSSAKHSASSGTGLSRRERLRQA